MRARQFEKRLRGGTILKIYVTRSGYIGKYTRFRFVDKPRAAARRPLRDGGGHAAAHLSVQPERPRGPARRRGHATP